MAKSIIDFLIDNPVEGLTETVSLKVERKGKEKVLDFTISLISGEELEKYRKKATPQSRKKTDVVVMPNSDVLHMEILKEHCVEPNFKDADAIKKAGCAIPEDLIRKVLKGGEIAALAAEIMAWSGFGEDIVEMREEVKNS